mmetsp:Transcript_50872/g.118570  ORF Transcript_50872/g.118570 Transcript_50872/m.118570 type:complete len:91 (-) Transcript_50872:60-332(-)
MPEQSQASFVAYHVNQNTAVVYASSNHVQLMKGPARFFLVRAIVWSAVGRKMNQLTNHRPGREPRNGRKSKQSPNSWSPRKAHVRSCAAG